MEIDYCIHGFKTIGVWLISLGMNCMSVLLLLMCSAGNCCDVFFFFTQMHLAESLIASDS